MKRRQRRQVLDINGEQSDSPRRRWQNKCEQIAVDNSEQNGGPSNPLINLLEQYNSDSEAEDLRPKGQQLDDKVNDFLKEIQLIAPEQSVEENNVSTNHSNAKESQKTPARVSSEEPSTLWQECFDDSTGYPYYWHIETNEVTWEVPEEIRLLRERNQQDSLNRTSYSTQWVNFSSNTYPQPQINIPEGMIPKEVVARNRNRQVSLQHNSQQGARVEASSSKNTVIKDDESDDGKIEMITSFGSDGSDSETSDNDSPIKTSSKESQQSRNQTKAKTINPPSRNASSTSKKTENGEKVSRIGCPLPSGVIPLVHGPENSSQNEAGREKWRKKDTEKPSRDEQSPKIESSSKSSTDTSTTFATKKSSAQANGKMKDKSTVDNTGKELKFSLVPGYADDSDVEDETTPKKSQIEPLFPIADFPASTASTIVTHDGTVKKVETKYTESGSVRIFQYQNAPSNDKTDNLSEEIRQMNEELESDVTETTTTLEETRVVRIEEEAPKPNIFLENLETPSKAFKRKRRIAFDVIPSKNRSNETESVNKLEPVLSPPATIPGDETDRHGIGFQKESRNHENNDADDQSDRKTSSPISEKTNGVAKSTISFVKGETMVTKTEEVMNEKTEQEINELKNVTEIIMEKLRFLSEGGQPASAVQVMAIQLQTLLAAWEARELKDSYLENWLTGTGRELERLEDAAAPPGWDCQWDRSHKRYFYRNSTTGEAQWTYPEADVIGGTEEMELCTTPPPQGQEEPCIIESQNEKFQENPSASMEKGLSNDESSNANKLNNETNDVVVPPPPIISSPSPPPPPRIYPEDLKKGKKRRGSFQGTVPDSKKDKCNPENAENSLKSNETVNPPLPPSPTKSAQPPLPPHPPIVPNPPNSEPLPPGVDPPDMPFTMSAPSIETTMLYTQTGPQTNPIYAATIGDPTAILGHHTALMQGQLMHYPTYHHHLHNQALIAAANRLTGQDAVQFMMDYSQVYANTQVIAKPPIKSHKESLGSAIDSFYSDIATIEKVRNDHEVEQIIPMEPSPLAIPQISQDVETPILTDSVLKERKKKKAKLGASKKQKEVSSMVAKWQKAQHYEDND